MSSMIGQVAFYLCRTICRNEPFAEMEILTYLCFYRWGVIKRKEHLISKRKGTIKNINTQVSYNIFYYGKEFFDDKA